MSANDLGSPTSKRRKMDPREAFMNEPGNATRYGKAQRKAADRSPKKVLQEGASQAAPPVVATHVVSMNAVSEGRGAGDSKDASRER